MQWHPTPVLLPGKSHGQRSLVGSSPWVTKGQTRLSSFHFHTPNIGAPQYLRQMLTSLKGEINSNSITVGKFSTPLTPMDIPTKQKISKETQTLNDTMDQLDLIDIYRTFHSSNEFHLFLKCTWNIHQDRSHTRP